MSTQTSAVPILTDASDLMRRYDVAFCDVWGVVHNGVTAYVEGCARLSAFRRDGGTVILVTNAPRTAKSVAAVLREKHVPPNCYDAIVSSGEVTVAHVAERGLNRVHHIGPDRDLDLFDPMSVDRVPLADAEAIVATGLINDRDETGEDYRAQLEPAVAPGLELICANPDLVVDVGGTLLACAGAIAEVYEDIGGTVYWAGKPHAPAYEMAHRHAERLRGV
ncbi:MAG: TIGR01459 family HAD-type hydrolase, partial [Pseudomonadota bacterium]